MKRDTGVEYYCETGTLRPYFDGYKTVADSDEAALAFFREKHGDKLIFVYDENYRTVYEKKS